MQNIKEYVAKRKLEIKEQVELMENKPKLVVVQVGNDQASCAYVNGKLKDCEEVGIKCDHIHLEEETTEEALLELVDKLNNDTAVTGFIVQLPLPKYIREEAVIEAIKPKKDVDGFSKKHIVEPATPQGIIDYLEANNFRFEDANAVVIGRSNIVGRPIARMLLNRNCNVRVIHSKTSKNNKIEALRYANLIVVATGHRNTLVDSDLYNKENEQEYFSTLVVSDDCFIVDVGMNKNDEGKLCGDCECVTACEKTPVPCGVGLLTRLALITNLLKLNNKR